MDIQGFNDRERAAENQYIRQKELEKAKARKEAQEKQAKAGTQGSSASAQGQSSNPAAK